MTVTDRKAFAHKRCYFIFYLWMSICIPQLAVLLYLTSVQYLYQNKAAETFPVLYNVATGLKVIMANKRWVVANGWVYVL